MSTAVHTWTAPIENATLPVGTVGIPLPPTTAEYSTELTWLVVVGLVVTVVVVGAVMREQQACAGEAATSGLRTASRPMTATGTIRVLPVLTRRLDLPVPERDG